MQLNDFAATCGTPCGGITGVDTVGEIGDIHKILALWELPWNQHRAHDFCAICGGCLMFCTYVAARTGVHYGNSQRTQMLSLKKPGRALKRLFRMVTSYLHIRDELGEQCRAHYRPAHAARYVAVKIGFWPNCVAPISVARLGNFDRTP
jgi:hypothetical protein